MFEVVLWDNDGVLVDTETIFFETTRMAFARLGLELTKELWGRHYLGEGKTSREIAAMMGGDESRIAATMDERNKQYRQVLGRPPPVRPQVRETLDRLFGRVRIGMVTGSPRDQLQLMHAGSGLLGLFETIVTGDECAQTKPHPELYLIALKILDVDPSRCIAIEDSPRGLASATAAGIACVVVPTELTQTAEFFGALSIEKDVSGVLRYFR